MRTAYIHTCAVRVRNLYFNSENKEYLIQVSEVKKLSSYRGYRPL